MFLELLATLSAGLFAGAAIYIDLAEQPARKQIDTAAALTEWRPYGAFMFVVARYRRIEPT